MYRYIIIDDEPLTRRGTREKLSPLTGRIQCIGEASDGKEALELLSQDTPDFIITDMKMPVLGGDALLPILTERYPDLAIIVISGYQDFNYSLQALRAKAVNYLVKPFSARDLIASVEQVIRHLENQHTAANRAKQNKAYEKTLSLLNTESQLRKLLDGASPRQLAPLTPELQRIQSGYGYVFCTVHSSGSLHTGAVSRLLAEASDHPLYFLPHLKQQNLGYLLLDLPSRHASKDPAFYLAILQEIHAGFSALNPNVTIGVSPTMHTLEELAQAYRMSIAALNQASAFRPDALSFFQAFAPPAPPLSWEHTDELLFCIESGCPEETRLLTENLFLFFQEKETLRLTDIKHCCSWIGIQINALLHRHADTALNPPRRWDDNLLSTLFSPSELRSYCLLLFTDTARLFQTQERSAVPDLVESVRHYIEHNYQKELSVEYLAALFHVNRTYLSHIFRFKTRSSLTEYLNQVRITQAKLLLQKGQKKIYQIADAVGYSNVKSFYRNFKKIEHTTPEAYRASNSSSP